jgi:FkbM family methyltransferase
MPATTILTFAEGIKVIVPDSLDRITTYVLEEQQDWFEDEIQAVRRLVQPGQTVIDIGANLGVYALSLAQVVGQGGRVVAFEPAPATAELLRASARLNGFDQLGVDQRGVAASSGQAHLAIGADSELNQLTDQIADDGSSETISLTSLDAWRAETAQQDRIAFIKIDAEGQELNILKGAAELLREESPLILFEIKHGMDLHLELVNAFAAAGYRSYRLLPGPLLLEPFNLEGEIDGFLLNLFCCKEDTARQLAAQGHLILAPPGGVSDPQPSPGPLEPSARHTWPAALGDYPYAAPLLEVWQARQSAPDTTTPTLGAALAFYALSCDSGEPPQRRAQALHQSVSLLRDICSSGTTPLQLASLARAARDAGQRVLAIEALDSLISALPWMQAGDFQEPFLAPWARFDTIPPGDSLPAWLMAGAIEAHETLRQYSSFFSGEQLRDRLAYAVDLGFPSAPLQRRLSLIERRFPQQPTP